MRTGKRRRRRRKERGEKKIIIVMKLQGLLSIKPTMRICFNNFSWHFSPAYVKIYLQYFCQLLGYGAVLRGWGGVQEPKNLSEFQELARMFDKRSLHERPVNSSITFVSVQQSALSFPELSSVREPLCPQEQRDLGHFFFCFNCNFQNSTWHILGAQ